MLEMFIKSITIDDADRIVIKVQDHLSEYLVKDDSKKMIKETLEKVLQDDFKQLEIAKTSARITVAEGKAQASKAIIESEIQKALAMAAQFMSQMNNESSNS